MNDDRFESVESQQATALREIAAQLERLNQNIERVLGQRAVKVDILGTVGVTSCDY